MRRRLTWLVLVIAAAVTGPVLAGDQPPPAKTVKRAGGQKVDLKQLAQVLETGTEAEILAALADVTARGADGAPAVPLINGLLLRGSSSKVVVVALEAVGAFGVESSSEAAAPYIQHRRPDIRQAAAAALVRTRGPVAVRTLRRALRSPDPVVRESAATGLGALGAGESVDELFAALGQETPGASRSIATLCNPEQCDRLMDQVGKLKFELLEPSFVPLILRPSGLPDVNKLKYIDRLRRMATRNSGAVLQTALAQLPADGSPKLREALQTALKGRPVVGGNN
jgi:HEAT repeat protein